MYNKYFNRLFDIIFSLILIVFLFPLMILIFLLIWVNIGFPIFSQRRPGLDGKIFVIFKFKTLYDKSKNLSEKKRQNKLGNFLRKTGLDELPQLFNILKNDMSFIGPRPLLKEYLKKYSKFELQRHLVKPGITGLAQVKPELTGKKSWKKSINLDIYYVKNYNLILDLKIILLTLKIIILNRKQFNDYSKR